MSNQALRRPYVCRSCAHRLRTRHRLRAAEFSTASVKNADQAGKAAEMYDVVCVGGGPAGLSLMTALKSHPLTSSLKLALIEGQDLSAASEWSLPPDVYSNRASSLTPASRAFLERIGAWSHLDSARVQAYERMQVWDGVSGARIKFEWDKGRRAQTQHGREVAYMTENPNLVRGLLARLDEVGGAEVRDRTKVADISLPKTPSLAQAQISSPGEQDRPPEMDLSLWPHLTLASGETLAARLLVGADGVNSPVRTFANIASRGWDYGRLGIVATLELAEAAAPGPITAFQRFLPTGPVAMLPLPGRYATLVWSTTGENARLLKSLAPKDFLAMVNAAFRLTSVDLEYLHTIPQGQSDEVAWRTRKTPDAGIEGLEVPSAALSVQKGSMAAFPLRLRHADTYATHRVALVGDAAHTVHPLAGQGLNIGIGDAESLAGALVYAVQHGMDLGDQLSLERYNAERYAANNALLGAVDKLHRLYSVGSGPMVGLRTWGLRAVDSLGPAKEFFMRQAAG